jgi:DNA-binding response OmpR family regulator
VFHFNMPDLMTKPTAPIHTSQIGRVLIVEENSSRRNAMMAHFIDLRWAAIGCRPQDIARHLHCKQLSLVAINAQLGSVSGLDILRQVRAQSHVPVLLYSDGEDDHVHRIVGLELGADDFMSGPLNLHELSARARAILRRQELGRLVVQPARGGYRFEGWELRHATRTLSSPQGEPVELTRKEYALLCALLDAPGRPLSRVHLMHATRAHEDIFDRSIDVQVLRLRRKLDVDPRGKKLIKTERGFGYTLDAVVELLF